MPRYNLQGSWHLYRRLITYLKPFWLVLFIGIAANMIYSLIDAGFTYLLKPFLNKGLLAQDLQFIAWIPWIILIGISARGIVSSTASYCMSWVARRVVQVFREQVFARIIHLPASYYDQTTSGKLLAKLLYDIEQIAQLSADALTMFIQSSFLVMGLLVVMFVINWQLSLFFLTVLPVVALLVRYSNRRIRRVSHAVQQSVGQVTEIAEEAIEGYRVVRIFGGQQYEVDKFNHAANVSRQRDMKVAMTRSLNVAGVQVVIAIGIAMIVLAAIHFTAAIQVSPGGFVAIVAAMLQLVKPMKNLTTVNSIIQRGLAGAESVFALFDKPLERDQGQQHITKAKGQIEFRDVQFAYRSVSQVVLHDINLSIQPGQTIAFVGRSGSGKSTLVNLLPRFYEISQGQILLDGIDIQHLTLSSLRRQIALVSQQVTLFNDTIANNIAYGLFGKVGRAAIERAARSAHAMEFIEHLPDGLDSLVGENGVLLSGGQRQRIAIARAILNDAPILILDEATSALDSESEQYIQAALSAVMQHRTTLVIAHRLSTIEKADHIVVLDQGRIIEQGNHKDLLARHGHYAALYRLQFPSTLPDQVDFVV